jgi:hypothetical protein
MRGISRLAERTLSFLRRTLLHGVSQLGNFFSLYRMTACKRAAQNILAGRGLKTPDLNL